MALGLEAAACRELGALVASWLARGEFLGTAGSGITLANRAGCGFEQLMPPKRAACSAGWLAAWLPALLTAGWHYYEGAKESERSINSLF